MTDPFFEVLGAALAGMQSHPTRLLDALEFYSTQLGISPAASEQALRVRVGADPNDPARVRLHHALASWDNSGDAEWAAETQPNTVARRRRIYALLGVEDGTALVLDECLPFYASAAPVVIEDPGTQADWYTAQVRAQGEFYWTSFRNHLAKVRSIEPGVLAALDESTSGVLRRLAAPFDSSCRKTRGLVVGYVQSGKTTHFTGLIAKAIDAGYRLIVVLSGTTDLLRNQTQRRLDMELVGRENILASEGDDAPDYASDREWPDAFAAFGARPSRLERPEIVRLTGAVDDFKSLAKGIRALEFEKAVKSKPLWAPGNLRHANARLVVVKKNAARIRRLISDLKAVGTSQCDEVPTLVIDDESDQASVNTLRSGTSRTQSRTRINGRIVTLLSLLPRAQYVGYTATPFANVFINPNDPEDLYPRHFIFSLDRPIGYMGVKEFHDLEAPQPGRLSNEEAHVRDVPRKDGAGGGRLLEAIDAFVLSGAIKLFREGAARGKRFRHHTMLVHESHLQADQWARKAEIERLWGEAAYDSREGLARLEDLLEDFRKVWKDRGEKGTGFPRTLGDLRAQLGQALDRITTDSSPVLVVNGDKDADTPDFGTAPNVWKIIVGGAKLSRGYTVEGLTVSYFRRRAKTQDTLMQMGRWFGFRAGYQDLVRLYIGRQEADGKRVLDLYDAFEALCRDEENFRSQLTRYREPGPDGRALTPLQVPALVFSSHPWLRPTAPGKMFNAVLQWISFAGESREPVQRSLSKGSRKRNADLFSGLLSRSRICDGRVEGVVGAFRALWTTVPPASMVTLLEGFEWPTEDSPLRAEVEYLRWHAGDSIAEWVILAPQFSESSAGLTWKVGRHELSCFRRALAEGAEAFKVFSEPRHLAFARWLVGQPEAGIFSSAAGLTPRSDRGVMVLYPTYAKGETSVNEPVMGFTLLLPAAGKGTALFGFSVLVKGQGNRLVVDTSRP